MFEVQDRLLIFDGECIITVSDAVKKVGNTFKASITGTPAKVHILTETETNILQASGTDKRRNI